MKLKKISICNYKSIETVNIEIEEVNKSYTYSLIGINESGKSSILNAINSVENDILNYDLDFHDPEKEIEVKLFYEISTIERKEFKEKFISELKKLNPDENFDKLILDYGKIEMISTNLSNGKGNYLEKFIFNKNEPIFYKYRNSLNNKEYYSLKKNEEQIYEIIDFHSLKEIIGPTDFFWLISHKITLWRSEEKYLLLDDIDLKAFAENPKEISIPLKNCFNIIGVEDKKIKDFLSRIKSPKDVYNLSDKLSKKVTEHINKVWTNHPIKINFQINDNKVSLLIEDKDVEYDSKMISQRSEGFKQFLSFLLTISAQNISDGLKNTLLLIDEPETHLHPTAQLSLLDELIKLTSNNKNNIVFFATHSNYLIDKNNLDRCFNVKKINNLKTEIFRFDKKISSYSEVNYKVFEIPTNDYHNELYGFIQERDKQKLQNLPKYKIWKNARTDNNDNVSLSEYIRHSIHHPENTQNNKFSEKELIESIRILENLKQEIIKTLSKSSLQ